MVLADSHEVSRAPCYSGNTTRGNNDFVYGTHTLYGTPLKMIRLSRCTHTTQPADRALMLPQPRPCNPCRVSHTDGLATSAFARHYSRNHCCFLFLRVLRCFTSPRSPLHPMYSDTGHRPHRRRGFPIRKSSDHSPLIGSPRHIADCHVLHRLLMPRHPPCALSNLQTDTQKYSHIKNKMLASTIQFSNNTSRPPHHTHRAQLPEASHRTHTQPPHAHPKARTTVTGPVVPGPDSAPNHQPSTAPTHQASTQTPDSDQTPTTTRRSHRLPRPLIFHP